MTERLSKAQREQIIFKFLRGTPDPLYDVQETKYGKYIVKPKPIEIEEEEDIDEPVNEPPIEEPKPIQPSQSSEAKRERRRRNRRAKQDAKRILDSLMNLINKQDNGDDYSDDEEPTVPQQRPPPLIEQPNIQPVQQLTFRRRRLVF